MPSILQSALHPAGAQAARIADLWWLLFWTCAAVYVIVIGVLLAGAIRQRRSDVTPTAEPRLRNAVIMASATTVVILFGILVASVATGRAIATVPEATPIV